jgi:hypothetical protein
MAISEARMAQVGLALFKARVMQEGLHLKGDMRRQMGAMAKEAGLEVDELKDFIETIIPELLANALGYHSVSITYGRPKMQLRPRA